MEHTILILLLPFLLFLTARIGDKRMSHRTASTIDTLVLTAAIVLSCIMAIRYLSAPRLANGTFAALIPYDFEQLPSTEALTFNLGIPLDPISIVMPIVVSTVSLMVHTYSFGYMKDGRGSRRYYAPLSLFIMPMLGLVVATNIFQMYLFQKPVGVSSYLLIGSYYTHPVAITASKKTFIVTRFVDLGFLIGILLYGCYRETFGSTPNTVSILSDGASILPLILGLMFIGGTGESAMFPPCIWLPDIMKGPALVSALTYVAIIVIVSVYLVTCMFLLFVEYAPDVPHLIGWVGTFTAFYAVGVAYVRNNIKRVLTFSTISRTSFMITTLGVCTSSDSRHGGLDYIADVFHPFAHVMFKVLFFLGAGNIIHTIHSNKMSATSGFCKYIPITHVTFLIACSAIAGIPLFSGFFSEGEILAACFQHSPVMGWVMTVTAVMTVFCMSCLYCGIFWIGVTPRQRSASSETGDAHIPHESPLTMIVSLIFLAAVTHITGFIPFGYFINTNGESYTIHLGTSMAITSTAIAVTSITLTIYMYLHPQQPLAGRLVKRFAGLHRAAYHRFCINKVCQFIMYRIIFRCISTPIAWFNRHVVDEFFSFITQETHTTSNKTQGLQSGCVQRYAYVFLFGALMLILILIL